jgi:uncharacterized membrane protein
MSYSWLQIRIGEALTPLPALLGLPAVAGITIGCAIANVASPVGLPDLILGPLLTVVAAILSWKATFGRPILACVYPIVINALGVSAYLASFYGVSYFISVGTVGLGEIIAAMAIGYPLFLALRKITKEF